MDVIVAVEGPDAEVVGFDSDDVGDALNGVRSVYVKLNAIY